MRTYLIFAFVFVPSVSLLGDDVLCWLLYCPLLSVFFSCFFPPTFFRFDLVRFRLFFYNGRIPRIPEYEIMPQNVLSKEEYERI